MIEDKLTGDSLKDRLKQFNHLVSCVKNDEFNSEFIENLSTKSEVDQLFLAELVNRFKNPQLVCQLLKSENDAVVAKILKCKWFFAEQQYRDVFNPDYFIRNVFAEVSFATKHKILNRMNIYINDTKLAEEFYEMIFEKYGTVMSTKLLPVCSEDFIKNKLTKKLRINHYHLNAIYKKYPKMIIENFNLINIQKYPSILGQIAMDDSEVFFKIFTENKCDVLPHMGYKTTLSLLKNKDIVIENASKLYNYLNMEAVLKVLKGEDRDEFIKNCFHVNQESFWYYDVSSIFKHFKKDYAAVYLLKMYKKAYNQDILKTDKFPDELIEHLPVDIRCEYAKKKFITEENNEAKYIRNLSSDIAFQKCLELIKCTNSLDKRSDLLNAVIDSCKIYKDTNTLLKLLKFTEKRYKNDHHNLRYNFLCHLQESFPLRELGKEFWDIIDDMLALMKLNKEIKMYYRERFYLEIMENCLYYRSVNNIDVSNIIDDIVALESYEIPVLSDYPEYSGKILDLYIERYKPLIENKSIDDFDMVVSGLITAFGPSGKEIRCIRDYPWLIEAIREFLPSDNKWHYSNLKIALNKNKNMRSLFATDILKGSRDVYSILMNILTHDFSVLQNKTIIENLVECLHDCYKNFDVVRVTKLFKSYLKSPIGNEIIEHVKSEIENCDDKYDVKFTNLLKILSILVDMEEYDVILKSYAPSNMQVDLKDAESTKEYQRGQILIKNLRLINPTLPFETILIFAKNDYLKFVLPSLLRSCMKKPEKSTFMFLDNISKSPVSLKKHFVRLGYFFYPRMELLTIYSNMWENEENASMRNILFKSTFRIFEVELDSDVTSRAFGLIKHFFTSFKKRDEEIFKYLHANDNVQKDYMLEYCKISWTTLKMLDGYEIKTDSYKAKLINYMSRYIDYLDDEICKLVFDEYFVSLERFQYIILGELSEFCKAYLLKSQSEKDHVEQITNFCAILKTYILDKWDVNEDKTFKYRSHLMTLPRMICKGAVNEKSTTMSSLFLLKSIFEMVKSILPFEVEPAIYMEFPIFMSYVEVDGQCLDFATNIFTSEHADFIAKFSLKIVNVYENLIATYGFELHHLFIAALKSFFKCFEKYDTFILHFVKQLLSYENQTRSFMFLLMDLIKIADEKQHTGSNKHLFEEVVERMWSFEDKAFRAAYGQLFQKPLSFYGNS